MEDWGAASFIDAMGFDAADADPWNANAAAGGASATGEASGGKEAGAPTSPGDRDHGSHERSTPNAKASAPAPHRIPVEPSEPPRRNPIRILDPNQPSVTDRDGEQLHQTARSSVPSKARPPAFNYWNALATSSETIHVADQSGDVLDLEIMYRIEERPAERSEIPDVWIYAERRAHLTLGSGEHATAQITGQARIKLAAGHTPDPKAAIGLPCLAPEHYGQIYLVEANEYVGEFGNGSAKTLRDDAAASDLLSYDDPLRVMMAIKRALKSHHVAKQGRAVAGLRKRGETLLGLAKQAAPILEAHIKAVQSFHDVTPGQLPAIHSIAVQLADWLADNRQQGRQGSEQAAEVESAHRQLLRLLDEAETAKSPDRDVAADVLGTPFRFAKRTAEGVKELGATIVDGAVLGVDALGKATGIGSFDWKPISKVGQWAEQSGGSSADSVVMMVNGFADQWSDALERARHGDYTGLTDVSIDTAMLIDGARATGAAVLEKGPALLGKVATLAKSARALAARLPAEVGEFAATMADAADAFIAAQASPAMQMATAGGGGIGGGGGPSLESLSVGLDAASKAIKAKRLAGAKDRAVATLGERLGKRKAAGAGDWVDRVEKALGDANSTKRFLDAVRERLADPAPFMTRVDALLGLRDLSSQDLVSVLDNILKQDDPIAVLSEIEWLASKPLSREARSVLVRRAANGKVDLNWVRRTALTDKELEIMGLDSNTSWVEFEQTSDLPSRRAPGRLSRRPPSDEAAISANGKIRGIAGELVAADIELPFGLKIKRRMRATTKERISDYELTAPDGSIAELEVKAYRADTWKRHIQEYESGKRVPGERENYITRLIEQIDAGTARGRKMYIAISDSISPSSRFKLTAILEKHKIKSTQIIYMSESEIMRAGRALREHMKIPQPGSAAGHGGRNERQ